jgi:hypothetical protein
VRRYRTVSQSRTAPPPGAAKLPPADEAKLAATTADLDDSIEASKRCTAEVRRFADDVDSERISMDGIVRDVIDEFDEDSLVASVNGALRGLGAV